MVRYLNKLKNPDLGQSKRIGIFWGMCQPLTQLASTSMCKKIPLICTDGAPIPSYPLCITIF